MRNRNNLFFFGIFFLLLATEAVVSASGKFDYGSGEGGSVAVSIPLGEGNRLRVRQVTDGDTVELENGEKVRYIGIDTPEEMRRVGEIWVYDPEPFAEEATRQNRDLVEGKKVRLEFDREKRDRFGRLLAYVYVPIGFLGDARYDGEVRLESHEVFVNAFLLEKGLAKPLPVPPNTRYADRFQRLAREAQRQKLGLWGKKEKGHIHARER